MEFPLFLAKVKFFSVAWLHLFYILFSDVFIFLMLLMTHYNQVSPSWRMPKMSVWFKKDRNILIAGVKYLDEKWQIQQYSTVAESTLRQSSPKTHHLRLFYSEFNETLHFSFRHWEIGNWWWKATRWPGGPPKAHVQRVLRFGRSCCRPHPDAQWKPPSTRKVCVKHVKKWKFEFEDTSQIMFRYKETISL